MTTYQITGGIVTADETGKLLGPIELTPVGTRTPESGRDWSQRYGVCSHHFDNEAYGDVDAWTQKLADMGVYAFRSGVFAKLDQVQRAVVRARELGLKILGIVATEKTTVQELRANLDFVLTNADVFIGVEGINEPDGDGGLTDAEVTKTVKFQKIIWDFVQEHDELAHVTVLSPALRRPATEKLFQRLADAGLLGTFDAVSLHHYLNGPPDVADLKAHIDMIERVWKCSRIWITETGGTTAIMSTDPRRATEAQLAAYAVRTILEWLSDPRVEMVFRYELMDDRAPLTVNEAHFGLFNIDGTPKPEVQAVSDFLATLRGDGPVDLSAVDLEVYAPDGVEQLLVRNADGVVTLWLWRPGALADAEPVSVGLLSAMGHGAVEVAGAARGAIIPTP